VNLAVGVEFFEGNHAYYLRGKRLSGITGLISRHLGLHIPPEFVAEHIAEGQHCHKAVQRWIETGNSGSAHPGVAWLTETLISSFTAPPIRIHSETLVSDGRMYASAADIIGEFPGGILEMYDIKKGIFKRDYVSWQLGIYKYLIEAHTPYKVRQCTCICLKDREYYPILPVSADKVKRLLYQQ
jgi:hypothetical protein